MNYSFNKWLLSIFFLSLLACRSDSGETDLLNRVEKISLRQPILALSMLDSISLPDVLSQSDHRRYLIQSTQLRVQLDIDISKDSLMPEAGTFYQRNNDWTYASLAEFNAGCILSQRHQSKAAQGHLIQAEKWAALTDNPALQGMVSLALGDYWIKESNPRQAIPVLQAAIRFYKQAAMVYPVSAKANLQLANAYAQLEMRDSALLYGRINFNLANAFGDANARVSALQELGDLEWQTGNPSGAEAAYLKALDISQTPENRANAYLSLAVICYERKDLYLVSDYVRYLEFELKLVQDPMLLASVYPFLIEWYREEGEIQKVLDSESQFNRLLNDIVSEKKSMLGWKESVKYGSLKKSYLKSRLYGTFSSLGLAISGLLLLVLIFFIRKQNRLHQAALLEAKESLDTLQTMAEDFQKKEDGLRQLALRHFNVLKRVALLDGMLKETKSGQEQKIYHLFNQAVYENKLGFDWDTFFHSINQLKDGLPEKVKSNYPQLTETEYRILILSFTGLSNKESSIILNLSLNTINSLRTSIRRKLNVPEYGDLESFVTSQL